MKLSKKKLQELKNKKISIEDLNDRYFINSENEIEVENILKVLNNNICSFKEIVDKFKRIKDSDNDPCLHKLLYNKKFFEELIQNNLLNKDDLEYLLYTIDDWRELNGLSTNTSLLKYIVDKGLFKEIVDKFKIIENDRNKPCLNYLLWNTKFFNELIENNLLNTEDTRYLLSRIDRDYELDKLCDNTSLIKQILNEFILDKETVDRFNIITENETIYTIFEYIEYRNRNNDEILKLNELNNNLYTLNSFNLTKDQKLELYDLFQNNDIARNTLIQIIDSHLEDQYNFESLKNLLTKDDKKKKIKMNI